MTLSLDDALERATRIGADVLRVQAATIDAEARWPREGIRALQQAGLGALVIPRAHGGHGHGLFALARTCEVLGRECPSTAISFGMHLVGSAVMAAKATPAQVRGFLEPICRGEHLTTLALSEPGSGSHFYLPETSLARTAEGFSVTGTKSFVTNGSFADSYVISVTSAGDRADPGVFSCMVVPAEAPRLTWGQDWAGWGMRGNSSRTMSLESTPIDRDGLLGREGDEIWFMFQVVAPYFLMAMAGTYLGVAAAALEEARYQLVSRRHSHSGATLAEQPIVQHRYGTLWAQVQRTRALVHAAARMGDAGDPEALPALCSAKAEVAECAERVCAEVMTLLGGRAYGDGNRVQRLYRDARAAHVMAPTTDVLRLWTGRALLGRPILGD